MSDLQMIRNINSAAKTLLVNLDIQSGMGYAEIREKYGFSSDGGYVLAKKTAPQIIEQWSLIITAIESLMVAATKCGLNAPKGLETASKGIPETEVESIDPEELEELQEELEELKKKMALLSSRVTLIINGSQLLTKP